MWVTETKLDFMNRIIETIVRLSNLIFQHVAHEFRRFLGNWWITTLNYLLFNENYGSQRLLTVRTTLAGTIGPLMVTDAGLI